MASGVGIAIEDAIVLAELVAAGLSVPDLMDRFLERRYERCKLVVNTSVQIEEWEIHPETPRPDPAGATRAGFAVLAQPI